MNAITFLFGFGLIYYVNGWGKTYSGSQIWRLKVKNEESVQFVRYLHQRQDLLLRSGMRDTMDVLIEVDNVEHVKRVLRREGIKHKVLVDDVQKAIAKQKPTGKKATRSIDNGTIADQKNNSSENINSTDQNSHSIRNIDQITHENSSNNNSSNSSNNTSGNISAAEYNSTESCATYSYRNENCSIHPDWSEFLTLSQIYEYMDLLAASCSKHCSVVQIGKSNRGKPIKVFKLTDGKKYNMAVFIDAGMHGMEWLGVSVVTYIMHYLATNFHHTIFQADLDWYIAPVVNPDGYEYTHSPVGDRLWRKNLRYHGEGCTGVDLNRNFESGWGGDNSSDNPCDDFYRGPHAFSEVETIAVKNLLENDELYFFVYISYHGSGELILNPISWKGEEMPTPDNEDNHDLVKKMIAAMHKVSGSYYISGEPSANLLMNPSGVSMDWAYEVMNITYSYSICVKSITDLVLPSEILPTCKENVAILGVIAEKMRQDMEVFGKTDYGNY